MNITSNYQLKSFNSRVNNQKLQTNPSFRMKQYVKPAMAVLTGAATTALAEQVLAVQNEKTESLTKMSTIEEVLAKINPPKNAKITYISHNGYTIREIRVEDENSTWNRHFCSRTYKQYDTLARLREELTEDGELIHYDKNGNIIKTIAWEAWCKYGGQLDTEYNPKTKTYVQYIHDPYRRECGSGQYTPKFPIDDSVEDYPEIYKHNSNNREMPLVGSKNFDGTVNAPTGSDKRSTLYFPEGTRFYYGPGDLRNGSTHRTYVC